MALDLFEPVARRRGLRGVALHLIPALKAHRVYLSRVPTIGEPNPDRWLMVLHRGAAFFLQHTRARPGCAGGVENPRRLAGRSGTKHAWDIIWRLGAWAREP